MSGEVTADYIVRGLISVYNWLSDFLTRILQETILKNNPSIAHDYGSAIALLISLTAIYILLTLVAAFRKILGIILALGWILLIAAIFLRASTGTG